MVKDISVFGYAYGAGKMIATTTASNIAIVFGIPQQTVLSDIKNAIKEIKPLLDPNRDCLDEWFDTYSAQSHNLENDCYLTKNGAVYIFMKYTGEHAAEAKVKYIKAFDKVTADLEEATATDY